MRDFRLANSLSNFAFLESVSALAPLRISIRFCRYQPRIESGLKGGEIVLKKPLFPQHELASI